MGFKTAWSMMGSQARDIFVTKSAKDIIWGYDDQLSAMARYLTIFFTPWGLSIKLYVSVVTAIFWYASMLRGLKLF